MSNISVQVQHEQIIPILCNQPLSASTILARLQSRFPQSGWTAANLNTRLVQGRKQGLYLGVNSSGNPAGAINGWQANPRALSVNQPANNIYEGLCANFLPRDPGCACVNPQSINH